MEDSDDRQDRLQPIPHPRRAHRPGGQRQDPQEHPRRRGRGLQVRRRPRRRAGGAARLRAACAPSCAAASLPQATRERIGLAVAERRGDAYSSPSTRAPRAPPASGSTRSPAPAASSPATRRRRRCSPSSRRAGRRRPPAQHLLEEAREVDWTDEELLEALAQVALNEFQSLIANAAALPQDQIRPDGAAGGRLGRGRRRRLGAQGRGGRASPTRTVVRARSKPQRLARSPGSGPTVAPLANGPRSITVVRTKRPP